MSRTAGYYMAFVSLGFFSASLGPTLPGLAANTSSALNQISYLFTARALGYLIGSYIGGRLYDRLPGHKVMALGLGVMALVLFAIPLIPLLWLLAGIVLAGGIAEGALDVGGNTLMVWVHRGKVGPFMNALHFFFGLGAFISPIVVAQLVLWSGSIRGAYWALTLLMLPPLIWLLRASSPRTLVSSEDASVTVSKPLLVAVIAAFLFLYVSAEVSFGGWIYTYALTRNLGTATTAAYLTSVFWGALTLGRLLAIPVALRLPPRTILFGDLFGCLAGVGGILLWPDSSVALWGGAFLIGFSMASIFPTMISYAARRMTTTGAVTAWFLVSSSAGAMLTPWIIGQLFQPVGPQVVVWVIGIDLLVALGVLTALTLRSSGMARG